MQTKSIRLPGDLLTAIEMVERREHIEEATAVRKLIRTGLETYVARLYRDGQITLREAAARLGLDLIATTDLLLDFGVKGNLDAHDVLHAIERFNL
jgi:hypothetical protein